MKSFILLFAALILTGLWIVGRNASAHEPGEDVSLPKSCTLMTMTPAERAVHLERLGVLRRAASAVKMSPDGFTFEVDLAVMSLRDLQGWAENEQKCCSYLKIESRTVEAGKRAKVRVVCPADMRDEVMQSFGLRVHA
jgi:hypothetical protein